jgi:hypothetical protein
MQESDAIAASALFVSVVALATSIYFSWCARVHNRKSVMPIPFVLQPDHENRIAVIVQNKGTGPLILKKAHAVSSIDGRSGHLIDFRPAMPAGITFSNFNKIEQIRAILPGDDVVLIDLPVDLDNPVAVKYRDDLRRVLGYMTIELTYTDVYDTRFPVYAIKLKWFHRRLKVIKLE